MLYGVSESLVTQSVQNAAALLITAVGQRDHITTVLHQLQWLPVLRRPEFKFPCLVHQSLSGQAPACLVASAKEDM